MQSHCSTSTDPLPFQVVDRRKRGYFTIDNVILDEYGAQLKPCGIAVYACLCRFANADQECWPRHTTIAQRTGMSARQVGREITRLAQLGLILITPRYNPETKAQTSNLYTLLEVEGVDTQSTGGVDTQSSPLVRQSNRTKLKNKDTRPKDKQERSYLPAEYRDIMLG